MAGVWSGVIAQLVSRGAARLVAVCLSLSLLLAACGGATSSLSGSYPDDTVNVAETLLSTISLAQDDPARPQAEREARSLISDYVALYRPKAAVNGLASFTTMQTALNSLAGHYTNYANRSVPDALRARLEKELKKAESSVARGA